MSTREMDQMDEELMGMVNNHAAPEAVETAEEICEDFACTNMANCPDPAETVDSTNVKYSISEKKFKELEAELERTTRRRTIAAVVMCAVVFMVLLMVLANPDLLIWLVNIGVVYCSVVTGIALDRWWHRR